ncbi:phosphatidylinositol-3-phosphatase YMR1 [Aspergillus lucknowensis]|uniref:Protein-tyrosine phosphatase-like protein n=1 Tax=Aspergillus lucknowensis TaxID=176173 RepID=A0ABR4M3F8_9EURO
MEKTRVAKVEDVTLARRGEQVVGTLHLTPHHIIFSHIPPQPVSTQAQGAVVRPRELWITYPIISFCTYRPTPAVSRQPSSIRLRCRDFTFVCFYFTAESRARDVYESIKSWTCKIGRVDRLYAFSFQPPTPERELDGWGLYDVRKELARQGVGRDGCGWRISQINSDYGFSPTYPALFAVPNNISDNTINYAGKYRSRARIPVLTYLHPVNNCSITRSSQPLVGFRGNRSIQDEKLLAAIFATTRSERPLANFTPPNLESESSSSTQGEPPCSQTLSEITDAEELEDKLLASVEEPEDRPHIYGAQQHNLIVDARPTVNALAMQAVGLGSENMDNYKFATKAYLGIDNIHVMRNSLNMVVDALKDSDLTPLGPNRDQLTKSGWLKHISGILEGASLIARQVALQHSHVLIHCSDGWDRTSQLSALSQICLDPYYRTMEGFMVLVEKDWLSFGHMFRQRAGHLNSEKWFQIENERIGGDSGRGSSETSGAGKALENAFLSAKGFFNRENTSRDSLGETDAETGEYESDNPGSKKFSPTPRTVVAEKEITNPKETSPVFHQFLDATYQMLYQYPTRFEFNERFLRRLLYHLYSCQYGTFVFNSEKERVNMKAKERTRSVWDYFIARKEQFLNPKYDPNIDDNQRGKERLVFPQIDEVRWWSQAFGRTDVEMNGGHLTGAFQASSLEESGTERAPVVTGVQTANQSLDVGVTGNQTPLPTNRLSVVTSGISSLSFSTGKEKTRGIKQVGVEMQ